MMQLDILCFGEPLMEFNETSQGQFRLAHGGDVSNCAIAAARQGARVGMLTQLGDDAFADGIAALWQAEGVDTTGVRRLPGGETGIYFVTHEPQGHAFSYRRSGSAASRITPDDVPNELISRAKILHASGISQAISVSAADAVFEAISVARASGVKVSYDSNLRLKLWPLDRARAIIHAAMAQSDIALPGYDDAVHLTGATEPDRIVDYYLGLGAGIVALTLGPRGVLVATPDDRWEVPAVKVHAIDATGAGDTFDGAFLAELCRGRDPAGAASYANAAAALSTTRMGAVPSIPGREAVERFLAGH